MWLEYLLTTTMNKEYRSKYSSGYEFIPNTKYHQYAIEKLFSSTDKIENTIKY